MATQRRRREQMAACAEQAICPSCGRHVDRKNLYRANPCEVRGALVCHDCIRRRQVLPPSWEAPAGTFKYRCKKHAGSPLGLGWQKIGKPQADRGIQESMLLEGALGGRARMSQRCVRLALVGLGNVGRNVLKLLVDKRAALGERYGLEVVVVGASDSTGSVIDADGLDVPTMFNLKEQKQGVIHYPRHGRPQMGALAMIQASDADMLVEMSPTNLVHGQPGLQCIHAALDQGWDVVTANKGPLVLAYSDIMARAAGKGRQVRFSACVGGGLPSVNVGQRDLVACDISRVEGILNSTTHYILTAMSERGTSFTEALAEAQRIGCAEANPSLDIDGWDAANKCVILANSVLGFAATLKDVAVTGIRDVTVEQMRAARLGNGCLKLLVTAEREGAGYRLAVKPTVIPASHPLAHLSGEDMGIVYYTDIMGVITVTIAERGPLPTAAAVLRDIVTIACGRMPENGV
jgi:homoserine dehydrogenase